jgi:glycosyltransferase involved in cell wall biosynthesis
MTGTSRYTASLTSELQTIGVKVGITAPSNVPLGSIFKGFNIDLQAFFNSYPLRVTLPDADLYHLPTQTMATLLMTQRFPKPVVVTVLDIIPYLTRHDLQLNTLRHPLDAAFYQLAMRGLHRAAALIAISEYTRHTLTDALKIKGNRIHVIYPSIDFSRFRPQPATQTFRDRYGLDSDCRYVLYVGSDDPRKNLKTLLDGFARLCQRVEHVKLLKVGRTHFSRAALLENTKDVAQNIMFFDDVPDEDLLFFYNTADVLVLPSLYEGFGYPAAEAMACGTPVIASRAASLPEVIGDAGLLFDPHDAQALAQALERVLTDETLRISLRTAGLQHVQRFNSETSRLLAVYQAAIEKRR